jgi:hypothetical protein
MSMLLQLEWMTDKFFVHLDDILIIILDLQIGFLLGN